MIDALEKWLPVVGYEGLYEVSDKGNVRSLARRQKVSRGGFWVRPGIVLKQKDSTHKVARKNVELYNKGQGKWLQVHRLVLEAFHGPCPIGQEACHNDGCPSNNAKSNLRWGTHASNIADKHTHGTLAKGSAHGMSKITETDVERMFDLRSFGVTVERISKWIGMSRPQTGQILNKQQWTHIHV